MKELKELRFNESNIQLKDNLVRGSILPEKAAELNRTITVQGNTVLRSDCHIHEHRCACTHRTAVKQTFAANVAAKMQYKNMQ